MKKRTPAAPKIWETFLPIVPYAPSKKDTAPACDLAWMIWCTREDILLTSPFAAFYEAMFKVI